MSHWSQAIFVTVAIAQNGIILCMYSIQGKDSFEVWKRLFEKVLTEGGRSEVLRELRGEEASDWNGLLDEEFTREEVEQALGRLK